jgi:O-antigen/teichoic acid export membrane protein
VKRRGSFRAGLGYGALSSLALVALGLFSSVAIARVYGVEEIGRYALALAPSLALNYLSSAQEQAALVRALSVLEPLDPRATGLFAAVLTFSTTLTLAVAGLTLAGTALLFEGPLAHPDLVGPAAALIACQALLTNTCWNLDMVLSAYRAGRELFWIRLLQALSFLLLALAGGIAWGTVWGLVAATAGSLAVGLIHRLVLVRGYMRFSASRSDLRAGFRELPAMVRFGIRLAPSGLANGLSSQVGIWALGAASSLATVGAYQRAWQLSNRFLEMNSRITEMLFPTLVERRAGGDHEGFDRALVDTSRYAAVVMLIPAAVGGGAGYGVMELFGPGFEDAGNTLAILLLVPALAAVANAHAQALTANDRPLTATMVAAGQLLLTASLTFALVPALGMLGAGLAWAVAYVPAIAVLQLLSRRFMASALLDLWPPRQLAALAMACVAGFTIARVLDRAFDSLAALPLALAAGTLAYAGAFAVCGGLAGRDRRRLTEFVARLRAPRRVPAR